MRSRRSPSSRPANVARRRFLATASTSVVAAGAAHVGLRAQPAARTTVSRENLAVAEHLAGVAFSDAERDLMLAHVASSRESYETIRAIPLDSTIEPAVSFHLPASARAGRPPASHRATLAIRPSRAPGVAPADLAFASACDLAERLRSRSITSTALTRLYLDRLEQHDPTLHCVVTLTRDLALEQAARADAEIGKGRYRGPLHGLPYGLKDLVATNGIRTTWGAEPYRNQVPTYDATVHERLREAGAVLVAKLSTGELAIGDLWFGGRTRNPWNPEKGSSGSSAGPAAAAAAGLVAFAIGTETNGSIVSPASTCGVTGLRPTYGRVSRHGVMALRWTMDKVGVIARSAADTAMVLGGIYGPDGRDDTVSDVDFAWKPSASLKGVRIGIVEAELKPRGGAPDDDGRLRERIGLVARAAEVLRDAGATLVPLTLPDVPTRAMYAVCGVEAGAAFDDLVRTGAVSQLTDKTPGGRANQLRYARFVPAVEYLRAQRVRTVLIRDVQKLFETVDLFLSPSDSNSVTMTNFTGHPAITVNCGFVAGLPVGLMLTGRYFDEARLVDAAHTYQQRTAFHLDRPALG